MTVSSTISRWAYNGDGSTTIFPYTNLIFAESDLEVYVSDTLQTLNTDYTVSGVQDNGGGSVTFISGAPASGTSNVVIVRAVPFTQGTSLPEGGPFPAGSVESAIDKVTVLAQQVDDLLNNKALALASSDPAVSIGRLPLKSLLALKFLGFDANGDPIAASGTSADLAPVSAFMNTLLDDGDAATARATLGLGALAILSTLDEMGEDVRWTGVISPTQLTSSQNNYNPTDLATSSGLRLDSDAARNITGLQGGSSGRILVLHYIGSNSITLVSESGSSTAANRFALPSDTILRANDALVLQYDSTSSRWRALGKAPPVVNFPAADGTSGQILKTNGTGDLSFSDPMTAESVVATTSGTSVSLANDLAALATATDIEIRLKGVSTNAANQPPIIRIGPSGGVVDTGYVSNIFGVVGSAVAEENDTDGIYAMRPANYAAADAIHGTLRLTRFDTSENYWEADGRFILSDGTEIYRCHSFITLADNPADISLTTPGGTATFDAGEARIRHR